MVCRSADWDCGGHFVVDTVYTDNVSLFFPESEPSELMKKPWFIGVLIGTVGGMLWLILCILTVWLCKRRKNKKKMKEKRYYSGGRGLVLFLKGYCNHCFIIYTVRITANFGSKINGQTYSFKNDF